MESNKRGRRGFGEAITDFGATDLPYIGDVVGIVVPVKAMMQIPRTIEKLRNGEEVPDQDLMDLNLFIEDGKRREAQTWKGTAGDIIRQMSGFATEFYAGTLLGLTVAGPPGSLVGLTAGVIRKLIMKGGKEVVETAAKKKAQKTLKQLVGNYASKFSTYVSKTKVPEAIAAVTVGGAAMTIVDTAANAIANVAQGLPAMTSRGVAERMISSAMQGEEVDYNKAAWTNLADRYIEYSSESVGSLIGAFVTKPITAGLGKLAGVTLGKESGDFLRAVVDSTFGNKAERMAILAKQGAKASEHLMKKRYVAYWGDKLAKTMVDKGIDAADGFELLKRVSYDGIFEEMGEERYADFVRGLFGMEGDQAGLANAIANSIPSIDQTKAEIFAFAMPLMTVMAANQMQAGLSGNKGSLNELAGTLADMTRIVRGGDKISVASDKGKIPDAVKAVREVADTQNLAKRGFANRAAMYALNMIKAMASGNLNYFQFANYGPAQVLDALLNERGVGPFASAYNITYNRELARLPVDDAEREKKAHKVADFYMQHILETYGNSVYVHQEIAKAVGRFDTVEETNAAMDAMNALDKKMGDKSPFMRVEFPDGGHILALKGTMNAESAVNGILKHATDVLKKDDVFRRTIAVLSAEGLAIPQNISDFGRVDFLDNVPHIPVSMDDLAVYAKDGVVDPFAFRLMLAFGFNPAKEGDSQRYKKEASDIIKNMKLTRGTRYVYRKPGNDINLEPYYMASKISGSEADGTARFSYHKLSQDQMPNTYLDTQEGWSLAEIDALLAKDGFHRSTEQVEDVIFGPRLLLEGTALEIIKLPLMEKYLGLEADETDPKKARKLLLDSKLARDSAFTSGLMQVAPGALNNARQMYISLTPNIAYSILEDATEREVALHGGLRGADVRNMRPLVAYPANLIKVLNAKGKDRLSPSEKRLLEYLKDTANDPLEAIIKLFAFGLLGWGYKSRLVHGEDIFENRATLISVPGVNEYVNAIARLLDISVQSLFSDHVNTDVPENMRIAASQFTSVVGVSVPAPVKAEEKPAKEAEAEKKPVAEAAGEAEAEKKPVAEAAGEAEAEKKPVAEAAGEAKKIKPAEELKPVAPVPEPKPELGDVKKPIPIEKRAVILKKQLAPVAKAAPGKRLSGKEAILAAEEFSKRNQNKDNKSTTPEESSARVAGKSKNPDGSYTASLDRAEITYSEVATLINAANVLSLRQGIPLPEDDDERLIYLAQEAVRRFGLKPGLKATAEQLVEVYKDSRKKITKATDVGPDGTVTEDDDDESSMSAVGNSVELGSKAADVYSEDTLLSANSQRFKPLLSVLDYFYGTGYGKNIAFYAINKLDELGVPWLNSAAEFKLFKAMEFDPVREPDLDKFHMVMSIASYPLASEFAGALGGIYPKPIITIRKSVGGDRSVLKGTAVQVESAKNRTFDRFISAAKNGFYQWLKSNNASAEDVRAAGKVLASLPGGGRRDVINSLQTIFGVPHIWSAMLSSDIPAVRRSAGQFLSDLGIVGVRLSRADKPMASEDVERTVSSISKSTVQTFEAGEGIVPSSLERAMYALVPNNTYVTVASTPQRNSMAGYGYNSALRSLSKDPEFNKKYGVPVHVAGISSTKTFPGTVNQAGSEEGGTESTKVLDGNEVGDEELLDTMRDTYENPVSLDSAPLNKWLYLPIIGDRSQMIGFWVEKVEKESFDDAYERVTRDILTHLLGDVKAWSTDNLIKRLRLITPGGPRLRQGVKGGVGKTFKVLVKSGKVLDGFVYFIPDTMRKINRSRGLFHIDEKTGEEVIEDSILFKATAVNMKDNIIFKTVAVNWKEWEDPKSNAHRREHKLLTALREHVTRKDGSVVLDIDGLTDTGGFKTNLDQVKGAEKVVIDVDGVKEDAYLIEVQTSDFFESAHLEGTSTPEDMNVPSPAFYDMQFLYNSQEMWDQVTSYVSSRITTLRKDGLPQVADMLRDDFSRVGELLRSGTPVTFPYLQDVTRLVLSSFIKRRMGIKGKMVFNAVSPGDEKDPYQWDRSPGDPYVGARVNMSDARVLFRIRKGAFADRDAVVRAILDARRGDARGMQKLKDSFFDELDQAPDDLDIRRMGDLFLENGAFDTDALLSNRFQDISDFYLMGTLGLGRRTPGGSTAHTAFRITSPVSWKFDAQRGKYVPGDVNLISYHPKTQKDKGEDFDGDKEHVQVLYLTPSGQVVLGVEFKGPRGRLAAISNRFMLAYARGLKARPHLDVAIDTGFMDEVEVKGPDGSPVRVGDYSDTVFKKDIFTFEARKKVQAALMLTMSTRGRIVASYRNMANILVFGKGKYTYTTDTGEVKPLILTIPTGNKDETIVVKRGDVENSEANSLALQKLISNAVNIVIDDLKKLRAELLGLTWHMASLFSVMAAGQNFVKDGVGQEQVDANIKDFMRRYADFYNSPVVQRYVRLLSEQDKTTSGFHRSGWAISQLRKTTKDQKTVTLLAGLDHLAREVGFAGSVANVVQRMPRDAVSFDRRQRLRDTDNKYLSFDSTKAFAQADLVLAFLRDALYNPDKGEVYATHTVQDGVLETLKRVILMKDTQENREFLEKNSWAIKLHKNKGGFAARGVPKEKPTEKGPPDPRMLNMRDQENILLRMRRAAMTEAIIDRIGRDKFYDLAGKLTKASGPKAVSLFKWTAIPDLLLSMMNRKTSQGKTNLFLDSLRIQRRSGRTKEGMEYKNFRDIYGVLRSGSFSEQESKGMETGIDDILGQTEPYDVKGVKVDPETAVNLLYLYLAEMYPVNADTFGGNFALYFPAKIHRDMATRYQAVIDSWNKNVLDQGLVDALTQEAIGTGRSLFDINFRDKVSNAWYVPQLKSSVDLAAAEDKVALGLAEERPALPEDGMRAAVVSVDEKNETSTNVPEQELPVEEEGVRPPLVPEREPPPVALETPPPGKRLVAQPMYYPMAASQIRKDLRSKYPNGVKATSVLVAAGDRTATTRAPFGKVGDVFPIQGIPGKLYRIVSIKPIDLSTPEGREAWSKLEGWDAEAAMTVYPRQVRTGAMQIVFEEMKAPQSDLTASLISPQAQEALARGLRVTKETLLDLYPELTGSPTVPDDDLMYNSIGVKNNSFLDALRGAAQVLRASSPAASKLLSVLSDSPVWKTKPTISIVADHPSAEGEPYWGLLDPATNSIYIHPDAVRDATPRQLAQVILHETIHAASVYAYANDTLFKTHIDSMYAYVRNQVAGDKALSGLYGFKNKFEFISESFSNRDFQRLLASFATPMDVKRSLYVAERVGALPPPSSVFDSFIKLVTQAINRLLGAAKVEALGGPSILETTIRETLRIMSPNRESVPSPEEWVMEGELPPMASPPKVPAGSDVTASLNPPAPPVTPSSELEYRRLLGTGIKKFRNQLTKLLFDNVNIRSDDPDRYTKWDILDDTERQFVAVPAAVIEKLDRSYPGNYLTPRLRDLDDNAKRNAAYNMTPAQEQLSLDLTQGPERDVDRIPENIELNFGLKPGEYDPNDIDSDPGMEYTASLINPMDVLRTHLMPFETLGVRKIYRYLENNMNWAGAEKGLANAYIALATGHWGTGGIGGDINRLKERSLPDVDPVTGNIRKDANGQPIMKKRKSVEHTLFGAAKAGQYTQRQLSHVRLLLHAADISGLFFSLKEARASGKPMRDAIKEAWGKTSVLMNPMFNPYKNPDAALEYLPEPLIARLKTSTEKARKRYNAFIEFVTANPNVLSDNKWIEAHDEFFVKVKDMKEKDRGRLKRPYFADVNLYLVNVGLINHRYYRAATGTEKQEFVYGIPASWIYEWWTQSDNEIRTMLEKTGRVMQSTSDTNPLDLAATIDPYNLTLGNALMYERMAKSITDNAKFLTGGDSPYLWLNEHYGTPMIYGLGFIGTQAKKVLLQVKSAINEIARDRQEQISKEVFQAGMQAEGPRPLSLVTDRMLKALFKLVDYPYTTAEAARKSITKGALEDLGVSENATWADIAQTIHVHLMRRLVERQLARENLNTPIEDAIEDPVAWAAVTGKLVTRFKDREFSGRTFRRRYRNYWEAYQKSGLLPKEMTPMEALNSYASDMFTATITRMTLAQMATVSDFSGRPLVVLKPDMTYDRPENENIVPEYVYEEQLRMVSQYYGLRPNPNLSIKQNLHNMVENLHLDRTDRYTAVKSPYPSIASFYAAKEPAGEENVLDLAVGGEVAGLLKHLVGEEKELIVSGIDLLKVTSRINNWMKTLSLPFSLFFTVSGFESLQSVLKGNTDMLKTTAPGVNETLRKYFDRRMYHPSEYVGKKQMSLNTLWRMVKAGDPALADIVYVARKVGIQLSDSSDALDIMPGMLDKDTDALATYIGTKFGVEAETRAKRMLRLPKAQTDIIFGMVFNTLKIYTVIAITEDARAKGLNVEDALRPWVNTINHSIGGPDANKFSYMTPGFKQLLNLMFFSWPWTLSAWSQAGGGILTNPLLKNSMTLDEAKFTFGQMWPATLLHVLFLAPFLMQLSIWLAFSASDDDKEIVKYDQPFIWNNEEGRGEFAKWYADITPLVRHFPWYKGDPTGERRQYLRFGKQYQEVFRWLEDPIQSYMSKQSQFARLAWEMSTGRSPGGEWDLAFKNEGLIGLFNTQEQGFMGSRAWYVMQKFLPFSALAWAQNPDAAPIQFFGPVSKGMSQTRAVQLVDAVLRDYAYRYDKINASKAVRHNLESLVPELLSAVQANGYDPKKVIETARGLVLRDLYTDFYKALNINDSKTMDEVGRRIVRINGVISGLKSSVSNRDRIYGDSSQRTPEQMQMMVEALGGEDKLPQFDPKAKKKK